MTVYHFVYQTDVFFILFSIIFTIQKQRKTAEIKKFQRFVWRLKKDSNLQPFG